MSRLRWSLTLLLLTPVLVLTAPSAHAVELGECATMSSTIVRGEDFLYVNASCSDGVTGHHPEITGYEPDPDEALPPPGWSPQFDHTNFSMETADKAAGEGFYRVHITWLNSDETIAYDTAYITVKFTVLTDSDLGVTGLAHHGSTAKGGAGSYSFQVTNAGDFASDVTYSVILSAGTSVPTLPGGCTLTSASALGTRVDCVIGTMGAPVDAALTVVNATTGSTADVSVSVFSPWASETEEVDGGHPNEAYLTFSLTDPPAGSGGSAPVKVKPKLTAIGKGKVKGQKVTFSGRVTFAIPAGHTGVLACAKKVTGSTKPAGVAHASKSKGRLVVHKATCTTRLRFALPRSYAGSKVKVVLSFPGNTAVRAFTRSSKLPIKKP